MNQWSLWQKIETEERKERMGREYCLQEQNPVERTDLVDKESLVEEMISLVGA